MAGDISANMVEVRAIYLALGGEPGRCRGMTVSPAFHILLILILLLIRLLIVILFLILILILILILPRMRILPVNHLHPHPHRQPHPHYLHSESGEGLVESTVEGVVWVVGSARGTGKGPGGKAGGGGGRQGRAGKGGDGNGIGQWG
jgi:hypothetical protein